MLAIAATAQLMVVLDVSVVFVALPSMRTDLHLSAQSQQWIVNSYTLTFAGFLLLGGRAGDYFGRKRVFILGLSIFVLSSLAGGLAQDGWQLITARTVQGLGSAMLAPATLSLLTTTYTEPKARARALGVWAAMGATGGAFGAVVGGILTDLLSWRWVLFVNVPIGAALITGAVLALPAIGGVSRGWRSLDLPGAATVTGGLALVIYAIVGTDSRRWTDTDTLWPLFAGVALLIIFVIIEARSASALVPLRIFKMRALASANVAAILIGSLMFGGFFFVSLYLQQVLHHSPLRGGLEAAPGGLAIMLGSYISTKLVGKVGPAHPHRHRPVDHRDRAALAGPDSDDQPLRDLGAAGLDPDDARPGHLAGADDGGRHRRGAAARGGARRRAAQHVPPDRGRDRTGRTRHDRREPRRIRRRVRRERAACADPRLRPGPPGQRRGGDRRGAGGADAAEAGPAQAVGRARTRGGRSRDRHRVRARDRGRRDQRHAAR